MLKLVRFLKGYRLKTIFGPFFKLVEAVFELFVPIVVAWIIDTAIPQANAGDSSGILKGGALILALGVVGLGFALVAQFFASRASLGFGTNLRRELYAHINTFSYSELDKFSTASLITRLTSDVNQTQQGVAMFIRLILRAPFIVVGAIVMTMTIDMQLSLVFLATAIVVGAILFAILSFTLPKYKEVRSRLTRENLSGARVVRAFAAEEREEAAFTAANDVLTKMSVKVGAFSALLNPLTYAIMNLGIIALLYFGGIKVNSGSLTQGEVIALVNYMTQILNALVVFANLLVTFTKASASAARINEVFAVKSSMPDGDGATPDFSAPAIDLKNVYFTYGSSASPSISNANLTLEKGETLGILGSTGSGKSTLISLITRLYDATEGTVNVFGNDVKNYTRDELSHIFGVVPQSAVLFKGTIRDNLQWGKPDATDEEIDSALKISQSAEFVYAKEKGLDSEISQDGKNLSGGQRQRLTIARALVGSPEILILDDSSSALDFATDAKLRKALSEEAATRKLTVINISQRAAGLRHCDRIIVMDDGKIVGSGKHDELYASCEVYREICDSQNKEGSENDR